MVTVMHSVHIYIYISVRSKRTNPDTMLRSIALFLAVASTSMRAHAQNSTAPDCVSTAPSGVDTSTYVFFNDGSGLCAACGDGVYILDEEECTCGDGLVCNVWPVSGEW